MAAAVIGWSEVILGRKAIGGQLRHAVVQGHYPVSIDWTPTVCQTLEEVGEAVLACILSEAGFGDHGTHRTGEEPQRHNVLFCKMGLFMVPTSQGMK